MTRAVGEPVRSKTSARDTQMGVAFWDGRKSAGRKRPVQWFEQPELWSEEPPRAVEPATPVVRPDEPSSATARLEALEEITYARRAAPAPAVPAAAVFRSQARGVRMDEIAKFLQVNNALHGLDAEQHRFSLPAGEFAARFVRALWKGTPVGTPFVRGC